METYADFRPYDEITRAEMAKITVLFAKMTMPDLVPKDRMDCAFFSDLDEVNAELQGFIVQSCKL